jgi:hypothetical protein
MRDGPGDKITDSELLDFLEGLAQEGYCPVLLNDDDGHWAVSCEGIQKLSDPSDAVHTTFFVEKKEWRDSIREAIWAFMEKTQ